MNSTKYGKVTLCFQGDFGMGYHVIHCREAEVALVEYAQYSAAVQVKFVAKGKRNLRGFVQGYKPTVVILDGHVDLKLPDTFGEGVPSDSGALVSKARHSACSNGWAADFDSALQTAVAAGVKVLCDYRGHNAYGRTAA